MDVTDFNILFTYPLKQHNFISVTTLVVKNFYSDQIPRAEVKLQEVTEINSMQQFLSR